MSMHNLIPQIGMNMICKREKKYLREGRVRGGGTLSQLKLTAFLICFSSTIMKSYE